MARKKPVEWAATGIQEKNQEGLPRLYVGWFVRMSILRGKISGRPRLI